MSLASEFKTFALKGNVLELAVAVVIGNAFGKVVTAVVSDLIMPLLAFPLSLLGKEWREYEATPLHLKVGDLAGSVLDFVIVSVILFLIVVKLLAVFKKRETPPAATTKPAPSASTRFRSRRGAAARAAQWSRLADRPFDDFAPISSFARVFAMPSISHATRARGPPAFRPACRSSRRARAPRAT